MEDRKVYHYMTAEYQNRATGRRENITASISEYLYRKINIPDDYVNTFRYSEQSKLFLNRQIREVFVSKKTESFFLTSILRMFDSFKNPEEEGYPEVTSITVLGEDGNFINFKDRIMPTSTESSKYPNQNYYVKVTFSDGGKEYAYKVSEYIYNRVKIGYKGRIENSNGFTYKDAIVTITNKGRLENLNLEFKDSLKEIVKISTIPGTGSFGVTIQDTKPISLDVGKIGMDWDKEYTCIMNDKELSDKIEKDFAKAFKESPTMKEFLNSYNNIPLQKYGDIKAEKPISPPTLVGPTPDYPKPIHSYFEGNEKVWDSLKTEQKIYVSSEDPNKEIKIHNSDFNSFFKNIEENTPIPTFNGTEDYKSTVDEMKNYFTNKKYKVIGNLPNLNSACCRLDTSEKNCYNKLNNKKENKIMKMFSNMEFGKYTGRDIKLSYKGIAFRNANDNSYVVQEDGDLTDVSDFLIDMDDMLYLMPVAVNAIKVGDVIKHNSHFVVVDSCNCESGIHVIDPVCRESKEIIPVKNMFGFNFVTKVVSLFGDNFFGASSASEDSPFGNMLPMLMMANDGDLDMKNIMMMSMMSGGKGMDMSNPMMMMALMGGDDSKMSDMLPFLMMQNGGFNFGSKPVSENKSAE